MPKLESDRISDSSEELIDEPMTITEGKLKTDHYYLGKLIPKNTNFRVLSSSSSFSNKALV